MSGALRLGTGAKPDRVPVPDLPASLSPEAVAEILRTVFGIDAGVLFSAITRDELPAELADDLTRHAGNGFPEVWESAVVNSVLESINLICDREGWPSVQVEELLAAANLVS